MKSAALALALLACSDGAAKPAARPAAAPAPAIDPAEIALVADALYDVFDTMAATVEAHHGDCPGMGHELDQLFDKSAPIFTRAREIEADKVAAPRLAAEVRRHDAQAPGLVDRISAGLEPCAGDADVRAAIAKMPVF